MFIDYYKILVIDFKSSTIEIKNAYKKQAKIWHPDVNNSSSASQKMRLIIEAKNILIVPHLREKYDIEYLRYIEQFKSSIHEEQVDYTIVDESLKESISKAKKEAESLVKNSLKDLLSAGSEGIKNIFKEFSIWQLIVLLIILIISYIVKMS